jgi:hypothetical protein
MKSRILAVLFALLALSSLAAADSLQLFAEAQAGASFNTQLTGGSGVLTSAYLNPATDFGTYEVECGSYTGGSAYTVINFAEPLSALYIQWGIGVSPIASWFYMDSTPSSWFWVEVYGSYAYNDTLLAEYQTVLPNGQSTPSVIGSIGGDDGIAWNFDFGASNGSGELSLQSNSYYAVPEPPAIQLLITSIAVALVFRRKREDRV